MRNLKMSTCLECQNCVTCQNYKLNLQNQHNCKNQNKPLQPNKFNSLTMWITRKCNLRCNYCFVYELHPNQPSDNMTDEVIKALPSFVNKYSSKDFKLWYFGGEPLVNFEGIQKVYETLGKKVGYGMTSNLTLMNEEKAQWLGQRNFSVLASIDGNKISHNTHRKYVDGKGTYDDAIKGLANVRLFINRHPQIRYTVSPATVPYVYESVKEFAEMGYYNIALEPVYETEWLKEDLTKYSEQLRMIADMMLKMPEPIIIKPISDMTNMFKTTDWKHRCGLAQSGIGMDSDGLLYPCHRFVATHDKKLSIGDVFNGPNFAKIKTLQESYTKPISEKGMEKCQKCLWKSTCFGSCLSCNMELTGSISKVPESYCDIISMYVETFVPKYLSLIMNNLKNKGC